MKRLAHRSRLLYCRTIIYDMIRGLGREILDNSAGNTIRRMQ